MPFNILLLPLIGGYFFIQGWNRTQYQSIRLEKERLLFHASLAGIFLLLLAFILRGLVPFSIPCVSHFPCATAPPFEYLDVSFLALALGVLLPKVLNRFWTLEDASKKYIEEEGDPFEQLINRALDTAKPVMLTLKGGKVYVGFVISSFVPNREQRTIHIVPLKSGYREDDKHRVHLTTDYAQAFEKMFSDVARMNREKAEAEQQLRQLPAAYSAPNPKDKQAVARYEEVKALDEARRTHLETVTRSLTEEIGEIDAAVNDFGIIIQIDEIVTSTLYNAKVHAEYFTHTEPEA